MKLDPNGFNMSIFQKLTKISRWEALFPNHLGLWPLMGAPPPARSLIRVGCRVELGERARAESEPDFAFLCRSGAEMPIKKKKN